MNNVFWSLFGFTPEIIRQINRFRNKIKITPSELSFSDSSDWKHSQSIVICNKTDDPMFDLYLILFSPGGESSEYNLEFKELDPSFEKELTPGVIGNTQFIVIKSEANGNFFKTLKISRIMPHTCITFNINLIKGKTLKIEAIRFSKSASAIAIDKDGNKAMPFVSLYNVKFLSYSLILKKKSQ